MSCRNRWNYYGAMETGPGHVAFPPLYGLDPLSVSDKLSTMETWRRSRCGNPTLLRETLTPRSLNWRPHCLQSATDTLCGPHEAREHIVTLPVPHASGFDSEGIAGSSWCALGQDIVELRHLFSRKVDQLTVLLYSSNCRGAGKWDYSIDSVLVPSLASWTGVQPLVRASCSTL